MSMVLNQILQRLRSLLSQYFKLSRKFYFKEDAYILLNPGHRLIEYKNIHNHYDTFLPHLSRSLPKNSLVIDVGANVGDTLASMLAENESLAVSCFEPDPIYFGYLSRNSRYLLQIYPTAKILIQKKFIGVQRLGKFTSNGTTAKVYEGQEGGSLDYISLDDAITESLLHFNHPKLSLLKSDVDGFDWDVIQSGMASINKYKPFLYFECLLFENKNITMFESVFQNLLAYDYSFVVFDNFGNFMMSTHENEVLKQLLNYTFTGNQSQRPISYLDILAFPINKKADIDLIIESFCEKK